MAFLLSTRRFASRRGFLRTVPTAVPPPDACAIASTLTSPLARVRSRLRRLGQDEQGSSAIEFSLLCAPFIFMLLYALQIGIFYMTQTALDAGVMGQADALQRGFNTVPASLPTASSLKSAVASGSGALIATDATLLVELRQLATLSSATVPITGGVADYGSTSSVLVLRAQSPVLALGPGFSTLQKVTSTAIVRRQGR